MVVEKCLQPELRPSPVAAANCIVWGLTAFGWRGSSGSSTPSFAPLSIAQHPGCRCRTSVIDEHDGNAPRGAPRGAILGQTHVVQHPLIGRLTVLVCPRPRPSKCMHGCVGGLLCTTDVALWADTTYVPGAKGLKTTLQPSWRGNTVALLSDGPHNSPGVYRIPGNSARHFLTAGADSGSRT